MRFSEALELRHCEVADVTVRKQVGQQVVAMIVPNTGWRLGTLADHYFEGWIWRVRREVFVGIDIDVRGMIDGEQPHLVEVDGFFQRLHEAEAELAVLLANRIAIDLYELDGSRNVPLVGTDPVSDYAGTEHVGDELVALAIPYEQRGAGAAAAVDLEEVLLLVAGNLNFILQNAGGPEHAHDIGVFGVAEADDDVGGILAEISVRAVDFKFLAIPAGEDFDLRPDSGFIVVQSLEREAEPMILRRAFVAQ